MVSVGSNFDSILFNRLLTVKEFVHALYATVICTKGHAVNTVSAEIARTVGILLYSIIILYSVITHFYAHYTHCQISVTLAISTIPIYLDR